MTNDVSFSVTGGALQVLGDDGMVIWQGLPDGLSVLDLRLAFDRSSVFVLLEPPIGGGRIQNLVRVSRHGLVEWHGELPMRQVTDAFVSLETDTEGHVLATTWSGYRVRLNPCSGRLEDEVFTK